jgi:hypothetical protein
MKNNVGIPAWVVFATIGLSIGISIWALVTAKANQSIDIEKIDDYFGLFFSVIGVVFTLFFVVIGIKATSIDREISKRQEQIEKLDDEIKEEKEQIESIIKVEMDQQEAIYSFLINLSNNIIDDGLRISTRDSINLSRARLAMNSRLLSTEDRLKRMALLDDLGDESDIANLEKIIANPTEDKRMKDSAAMRKMKIINRINMN